MLKSSIAVNSITFISSDSGSAQNFRDFEDGFAAYAASKAALNQALRHMAAELKRKDSKTTILALHPGEVATDMAKEVEVDWEIEAKILSVQESVSACIGVIQGKGLEDSGTFWTWEDKVGTPPKLEVPIVPLMLRSNTPGEPVAGHIIMAWESLVSLAWWHPVAGHETRTYTCRRRNHTLRPS